jgi:hypothetical protein
MAIRLACPVCGTDRFKAPNRARGKRCRCPECRSSFRLTDGLPVLEWGTVPNRPDSEIRLANSESIEVPEATQPAVKSIAPTQPEPVAPAATPPVKLEPVKRSSLVPRDPGNQFALAAAALTGLGLVATVVPYGRFAAILLIGLGILTGLLGLLAADRSRRWALASAVGSILVLAVACLAPGWLGMRPWWEVAPIDDDTAGRIRAVSRSGGGAAAAADEWVDASLSVWRQDDVQVAASATVGPLELVGPKGQKKWTREKCLQITVKVANEGVERRIAVSGWPLADGSAPRATADGTPLTSPKFESGWSPVTEPTAAGVYPGKSHTQVFVYTVPAVGDVLLTIPAAGIGSQADAKLRIPRTVFAPAGKPRR